MIARISNMHRTALYLGLTGLLLAGLSPLAHADTPSYTVTGWDFEGAAAGQVGDYTLGYNFTPTHDIIVSALGEWVPNGDAIVDSETVGIFDGTGNLLFSSPWNQANATLTSNTLPSGSQFRYVDITSLYTEGTRTLLSGQTYTMAGTVGRNTYSTNGVDLTPSADITLTSDGLFNGGDTISGGTPSAPIFDAGYNMYGVNFEVSGGGTPAATPEPGTWAMLCGLTTCGLGLARRRRKV